jgi:hypothetical protein
VMRGLFRIWSHRPLGLRKSAGCGDRLGLATPGHLRAIRKSTMAPILAQQSIRENARTGRTPQQVMDEAIWGDLCRMAGAAGSGADADHLEEYGRYRCLRGGRFHLLHDRSWRARRLTRRTRPPVEVLRQKIGQLPCGASWRRPERRAVATRQAVRSISGISPSRWAKRICCARRRSMAGSSPTR